MSLTHDQNTALDSFVQRSDLSATSIMLDLDGTALVEEHGKVFISGSVEKGAAEFATLRRPVIFNTLRSPLSLIKSITREWIAVTHESIPAVMLNGSFIGEIDVVQGELVCKEIKVFPLSKARIHEIFAGIEQLLVMEQHNFVFLYYPRDWRAGEQIWVPGPNRVEHVKAEYLNASHVYSSTPDELIETLVSEDICMVVVVLDLPHTEPVRQVRMAYQLDDPWNFYTELGVDKISSSRIIAQHLGVSLLDSMGAGDTRMDTFLSLVGLAVIVGKEDCPYRGLRETIQAATPLELGEIIHEFALRANPRHLVS